MNANDLDRAAAQAFAKDLAQFLWNHPYWARSIATGTRQDRRRLAAMVAKQLTTIPKVGDPKVPG